MLSSLSTQIWNYFHCKIKDKISTRVCSVFFSQSSSGLSWIVMLLYSQDFLPASWVLLFQVHLIMFFICVSSGSRVRNFPYKLHLSGLSHRTFPTWSTALCSLEVVLFVPISRRKTKTGNGEPPLSNAFDIPARTALREIWTDRKRKPIWEDFQLTN